MGGPAARASCEVAQRKFVFQISEERYLCSILVELLFFEHLLLLLLLLLLLVHLHHVKWRHQRRAHRFPF
jgi:hypothetical protein